MAGTVNIRCQRLQHKNACLLAIVDACHVLSAIVCLPPQVIEAEATAQKTSISMLAKCFPEVLSAHLYRPMNVSCALSSGLTHRIQMLSCSFPEQSRVPSYITENILSRIFSSSLLRTARYISLIISFWEVELANFVAFFGLENQVSTSGHN